MVLPLSKYILSQNPFLTKLSPFQTILNDLIHFHPFNPFSHKFSTFSSNHCEKLSWERSTQEILLQKLKFSLRNHQSQEALETFHDFRRLYGYPDVQLLNQDDSSEASFYWIKAGRSNRTVVYEYVENGNLHTALLGKKNSSIKLEWRKRSAICVGTGKGLAYLHEELAQHIVHRDIKASNVLLDKDFNPKSGDFGMAKLFPDDITHISTRIAGTTGYLAPEYALGGQLTKKADVYSFGVLILEIISGKSSSRTNWDGTHKFLLEWAWQLHEDEKWLELVDEDMEEYPEKEVIKYIKVALFCTQAAAKKRPLMTQVVDMLSKEIQLNEKQLTAPGLFNYDVGESSQKKSNPESLVYHTSSTQASITQVTPR